MLRGLACLVVLAGPVMAEDAAWRPIQSAEGYAAVVSGRSLVETNGQSRWDTAADQSIKAVNRGDPYEGRWDWVDGAVCYDGAFQSAGPVKICGRVQTNGSQLAIDWATGGRSIYRVE